MSPGLTAKVRIGHTQPQAAPPINSSLPTAGPTAVDDETAGGEQVSTPVAASSKAASKQASKRRAQCSPTMRFRCGSGGQ